MGRRRRTRLPRETRGQRDGDTMIATVSYFSGHLLETALDTSSPYPVCLSATRLGVLPPPSTTLVPVLMGETIKLMIDSGAASNFKYQALVDRLESEVSNFFLEIPRSSRRVYKSGTSLEYLPTTRSSSSTSLLFNHGSQDSRGLWSLEDTTDKDIASRIYSRHFFLL